MKKFNINAYVYIQITEEGWAHLEKTQPSDYVNVCIKPRLVKIDGEIWYKLQCWTVFELFPVGMGLKHFFNINILIDDDEFLT